ncbi:hypothetical protein QBC45DRAFT_443436 [Copromyces sp. CBS 386.78]|nr:hypothetical protein QBC45DRAFT_443436 [Copromyces sp. CBS 386.78]
MILIVTLLERQGMFPSSRPQPTCTQHKTEVLPALRHQGNAPNAGPALVPTDLPILSLVIDRQVPYMENRVIPDGNMIAFLQGLDPKHPLAIEIPYLQCLGMEVLVIQESMIALLPGLRLGVKLDMKIITATQEATTITPRRVLSKRPAEGALDIVNQGPRSLRTEIHVIHETTSRSRNRETRRRTDDDELPPIPKVHKIPRKSDVNERQSTLPLCDNWPNAIKVLQASGWRLNGREYRVLEFSLAKDWIRDQSTFPIDAVFPIPPGPTECIDRFLDAKLGFQLGYATRVLTALLSNPYKWWFTTHFFHVDRDGKQQWNQAWLQFLSYLTIWSYVFEKFGKGGALPHPGEQSMHLKIKKCITDALSAWDSPPEIPPVMKWIDRCNAITETRNTFRTKLNDFLVKRVAELNGKVEREKVISPFASGFMIAGEDMVSTNDQGIQWAKMDEEMLTKYSLRELAVPDEL